MARRVSAGVAASLLVCTLLACSYGGNSGDEHDDNNFRGDVIECEDALDRLERCCPGFDAKVVECNFYHSKTTGCGTVSTDDVQPALSRDESACIRDTSCDSLVATKVCARAQEARAYSKNTSTPLPPSGSGSVYNSSPTPSATSSGHRFTPVCP